MKTNNEASKGSEPFSMYGFGTLLKNAISKIMFSGDDRHWCLNASATILLYDLAAYCITRFDSLHLLDTFFTIVYGSGYPYTNGSVAVDRNWKNADMV
jgi:hypothetical protein